MQHAFEKRLVLVFLAMRRALYLPLDLNSFSQRSIQRKSLRGFAVLAAAARRHVCIKNILKTALKIRRQSRSRSFILPPVVLLKTYELYYKNQWMSNRGHALWNFCVKVFQVLNRQSCPRGFTEGPFYVLSTSRFFRRQAVGHRHYQKNAPFFLFRRILFLKQEQTA